MNKTMRRILTLALALITVMSLYVPSVSATEQDTQDFVFPEWTEPLELGIALQGELSTREHAVKYTKNGKDYLLINSRAGTAYVFKLTDFLEGNDNKGTWIEHSFNTGTSAHNMVVDSKGKIYLACGDIVVFDPETNQHQKLPTPLSGISYGLAVDEEDNLYIARQNAIIKMETTNYTSQIIYEADDIAYASTVEYGDGYIYVSGKKTGSEKGLAIQKVDQNGNKVGEKVYANSSTLYYMTYVDGILFGGHSGNVPDGMICVNTETMEHHDVGVDNWIMGLVTNADENGKHYFQVASLGVWQYDPATRQATRADGLVAWSTNLRIKDPYIDVTSYGGISGKCLLTVASGGAAPSILSLEGQGFASMEALVEEGVSPAQVRSIVSGVPGLKVNDPDDQPGTEATEVAVYFGGYLASRVGRYSPSAVKEDRLESNVFHQGRAQTDSMILYQDKIYGGSYSGGYLWEFDPATGVHTELIHGMLDEYYQARVHGLTVGDNKVFFSTVPSTSGLGGCLGWWNLETGEWEYMERNLVEDQIFISIHYDEKTDLLYAASSIAGGSKAKSTATEAVIMVFDVAEKKKLGEFSVRAEANPDSDMVFDLEAGAVIPEYISCVTQDPATGKFWGIVSNTLFSFEYDKASNRLKIHEEMAMSGYVNLDKGRYPTGGSLQWFERPILFNDSEYMYASFEAIGYVQRIEIANPSNHVQITKQTGKMAIGTDGNLYIGAGDYVYQVGLTRPGIVKTMIDGTEPKDKDGVALVRNCYEALTDEEKAVVGDEYYQGLVALEGAAEIFRQVAAEKTDKVISAIGAVTISAKGSILAARTAYDGLDEKEKAMVTKYDELVAAEQAYEAIRRNTGFGLPTKTVVSFSLGVNPRAVGVAFKEIQYKHITGGIWEYACGSAKFNQGARIQMSFGATGEGYLGIRVKFTEAGLYNLVADTQEYSSGGIGAVYMFPANNRENEELYAEVKAEVTQCKESTEHYIGTVDYTVSDIQSVGQWYCEEPGEYILAFGRRETRGGDYGRLNNITFSKENPTTDATVELVKNRINAIGKVTKNSGTKIQEARYTYDALSDAQKALIYAPQLEKAEAEYAEVVKLEAEKEAASAAKVLTVRTLIDSIGTVTEKSGDLIRDARKEFNKLTAAEKKQAGNESVLIAAEEAYEKLMNAQTPAAEDGMDMTYIIIGAAAAVVILAVILIIAKGKKKKTSEEE